jgi:predicted nucleic acid-binding Zn ribbon protein
MLYEYKCPVCNRIEIFNKSIEERDYALCSCGALMNRIFTPPNISSHSLPTRNRLYYMKSSKKSQQE